MMMALVNTRRTFFFCSIITFFLSCVGETEFDPVYSTSALKKTKFVQLCDVQLGFDGYEKDLERFEVTVKKINSLNPDFVVVCGDFVNSSNDKSNSDFKRIASKINAELKLVAGNHDVGMTPSQKSLVSYRENYGEDYYDFEFNNMGFLITNSQLWRSTLSLEIANQDSWLLQSLEKYKNAKKSMFIFGHIPLFQYHYLEDDGYFNFSMDDRSTLLGLFEDYKVKAYLSGYAHRYIHNIHNSVMLVTGESISRNFGGEERGVRLWEVDSSQITNSFISIEDGNSN